MYATFPVDEFTATARALSGYRRKTIERLTADQPALRRAAVQLRCDARATKLPRRLRRKVQLGRNGSF